MPPFANLQASLKSLIVCSRCKNTMRETDEGFLCVTHGCSKYGFVFPVIDGIPILIDDEQSIFSVNDFRKRKETTFKTGSAIMSRITRGLPSLSLNVAANSNYAKFEKLLCEYNDKPKILVVGGSIVGRGMERIIKNKNIEFIEIDVSFGPQNQSYCRCTRHPSRFRICRWRNSPSGFRACGRSGSGSRADISSVKTEWLGICRDTFYAAGAFTTI